MPCFTSHLTASIWVSREDSTEDKPWRKDIDDDGCLRHKESSKVDSSSHGDGCEIQNSHPKETMGMKPYRWLFQGNHTIPSILNGGAISGFATIQGSWGTQLLASQKGRPFDRSDSY